MSLFKEYFREWPCAAAWGHSIVGYADLAICTRCAAYASERPRLLLRPCRGRKSDCGVAALAWVRQGFHPTHGRQLGPASRVGASAFDEAFAELQLAGLAGAETAAGQDIGHAGHLDDQPTGSADAAAEVCGASGHGTPACPVASEAQPELHPELEAMLAAVFAEEDDDGRPGGTDDQLQGGTHYNDSGGGATEDEEDDDEEGLYLFDW